MISPSEIREKIFRIKTTLEFNACAIEIFHFQYHNNLVYQQFIRELGIEAGDILHYQDIPFLPVSFFKTHRVYAGDRQPVITFASSRTTGSVPGLHRIADIALYETSLTTCFELFYGPVSRYCLLALLPSYLEREDSSLVHMAGALIRQSGHPLSGFYLDDFQKLAHTLEFLKKSRQKTILLGVSFALLNLVESHPVGFPGLIVMETGGMKGRRKEMIREELHTRLCAGFGVETIHSEYGMTELLSQAYSKSQGTYRCPPWMSVLVRDINDPLSLAGQNQTGGINIIDLANLYSCSFIATEDLGRIKPDGSFEVLGRFDNSDIRGCNLLV